MTDLENNLDVNEVSDDALTVDAEKEVVAKEDLTTKDVVAEEPIVKESLPVISEETKSENVISSGSGVAKPTDKPAITPVGDGVIGSGKSPAKKKVESKPASASAPKVKKVAVFSNRNVVWQGVGKIVKGYNLVEEAAAEKWLTLDGIRKVDPQEVKSALG